MAQSLKDRIVATKFKDFEIKGITFKLKKFDALELQRLAIKTKSNPDEVEIEIILNSIKAYKGLKLKDIIESEEGFTAKELDEDLPFDREYLEMYLGKNQDVLIEIYQSIAKDFVSYTDNQQKKTTSSDTEQSKSSSDKD